MVKVNGVEADISGKTISEYLASTNYDRTRIAVELNCSIVPKTEYDAVVLKDQDIVEVVSFVGGG
jgi:sulfur carrier protein